MTLEEQILEVLRTTRKPYTASEITASIEGADSEKVSQTLTQLEEKAQVMGLRSIDSVEIGYLLL